MFLVFLSLGDDGFFKIKRLKSFIWVFLIWGLGLKNQGGFLKGLLVSVFIGGFGWCFFSGVFFSDFLVGVYGVFL